MEIPAIDLGSVAKAGAGGSAMTAFVAFVFRIMRGDLRRAVTAQGAVNEKLWAKTDAVAKEIDDYKVKVAEEYVRRADFSEFRTHIDAQFEKTREMLFKLAQGSKS